MQALTRFLVAASLAVSSTPMMGQTIRTLVVDANDVPTSGGFVLLIGPDGREADRVLNNEDGLVALHAPRTGQYRLVSERLGFMPSTSEPFTIDDGQTMDLTLRLAEVSVDLAGLPVGERTCTVAAAADSPEGRLWAEVRKGLTAAMFAPSPRHFDYVSAVIERDVAPDGRRVYAQEMRVARGPSLYESVATAGRAARDGFIVSHDDGSFSFQAPDSSVFLAPDFVDTHCLTARRDPATGAGLLTFETAAPGGETSLIGTFRVALETGRLQRLEYRFTPLPHSIDDDRVGGTVNFMEGPSGKLIARDWELRTPVVGLDQTDGDTVVTSYLVVGGAVASITDHTGATVYATDVAELHGAVVDSLERPLAGAHVAVLGTDYSADTDGGGRFRIAGLLDGEYAVAFSHASLDSAIAPPPTMVEFEPGRTDSLTLRLMSVDDLLADLVGAGDSATRLEPIEVSAPSGGSGNVISRADLEDYSDLSAYDAVLRLRPGWTRGRGVANLQGQAFTTGVFRNGRFIGGLSVLTRIHIEFVEEIRYYSRRDAQTRWGFGNDVIEIIDRK